MHFNTRPAAAQQRPGHHRSAETDHRSGSQIFQDCVFDIPWVFVCRKGAGILARYLLTNGFGVWLSSMAASGLFGPPACARPRHTLAPEMVYLLASCWLPVALKTWAAASVMLLLISFSRDSDRAYSVGLLVDPTAILHWCHVVAYKRQRGESLLRSGWRHTRLFATYFVVLSLWFMLEAAGEVTNARLRGAPSPGVFKWYAPEIEGMHMHMPGSPDATFEMEGAVDRIISALEREEPAFRRIAAAVNQRAPDLARMFERIRVQGL